MNLKFYLRGLGIGIVVTAIIMLVISSRLNKPLSDDEIKQRAGALGMVEAEGRLSDVVSAGDAGQNVQSGDDVTEDAGNKVSDNPKLDAIEQLVEDADAYLEEKNSVDHEYIANMGSEEQTESKDTPEPTPQPTKEPEPTPQPTKEPEPTPQPTKEPEPTSQPASQPSDNSASDNSGNVKFVINKGESSFTIAKNLEAAGIISSARSFDTYLCDKGYDRHLSAGTYDISSGMSEEELAKLLTGK